MKKADLEKGKTLKLMGNLNAAVSPATSPARRACPTTAQRHASPEPLAWCRFR